MIMLHFGRKGDRLRNRNPPIHRNPSDTQGIIMSSTCILNISKSLSFVSGILGAPILFSPTAYYKIYKILKLHNKQVSFQISPSHIFCTKRRVQDFFCQGKIQVLGGGLQQILLLGADLEEGAYIPLFDSSGTYAPPPDMPL